MPSVARPAGRTPSGSGTSKETSVVAPRGATVDAAVAQQPGEAARRRSTARSCTAVEPGLLEHVERRVRPLHVVRDAGSRWRAGARPAGAPARAPRSDVLQGVVAAPGRGQARARAPGSRTGSRCRPGRTATSGRRRRRSRSRARATSTGTAPRPCAPSSTTSAPAAASGAVSIDPAGRPGDVRGHDEARVGRAPRPAGPRTARPARVAPRVSRAVASGAEHAGVLLVAREDLVAGLEVERRAARR